MESADPEAVIFAYPAGQSRVAECQALKFRIVICLRGIIGTEREGYLVYGFLRRLAEFDRWAEIFSMFDGFLFLFFFFGVRLVVGLVLLGFPNLFRVARFVVLAGTGWVSDQEVGGEAKRHEYLGTFHV